MLCADSMQNIEHEILLDNAGGQPCIELVLRLQECAGRLLAFVDVLHCYQQADSKGTHRQSRRN